MKRGPRPWTPQEKAQVTAWRGVGRSDEWIAQRLGRTRGSVQNLLQYGSMRAEEKPAKKARSCLRCRGEFASWGAGNRICERCKAEHARLSPLARPMGDGCHVAGRGTR